MDAWVGGWAVLAGGLAEPDAMRKGHRRYRRMAEGWVMHHLTMAQKSLLIGDEVADLLLAYAAQVAGAGHGAHITVRALGVDGVEVAAQLLLNAGTVLVAESSTSQLPEPDNTELVLHLRDRLRYYGALPGDEHWPGAIAV